MKEQNTGAEIHTPEELAEARGPAPCDHMACDHMARDQYGETYHALGNHPRKELLKRLGRKKAERMYRAKRDGRVVHVGWIIGGLWLMVYEVRPMERAA